MQQSEAPIGGSPTVVQALESSVSVSLVRGWRESTAFVSSQGLEVQMRRVPPSLMPTFQRLTDKLFTEAVFPMVEARTEEELKQLLIPCWNRFGEILAVRDGVAQELVGRGESLPGASEDVVVNAAVAVLGNSAASEFRFSTSTYVRALRLSERVNAVGVPSENLKVDAEFAAIFRRAAVMHVLGASLFLEFARRTEASGISIPVWKGLFSCSMVREGALSAFAAVSQGARLRPEMRRSADPVPAEMKFDDEHYGLANWDG